MPELDFKGKEFVRNHHLTVPFRPLIPDPSKSIGEPDLDGNLVIHGDNLEALKSLLPMYAGKVDCIFIDPPYNTGNEGWSYNDNVNSPILKAWFSENPVGLDDTLRHDKWCAMMWPRLRLLWELLAPGGSIWITLDDNEAAAARLILDELFTESNFIATIVWHKMDSPKNTAQFFSEDHDYILVYAKNKPDLNIGLVPRTEQMIARYQNPDGDPRGPWLLGDLAARNFYSQGLYEIVTPSGRRIAGPPRGSYWRVSEAKLRALDEDNRLYYGPNGDSRPGLKRFLSEVREGVVPQTIWHWEEVGSTRNAKQGLQPILAKEGEQEIFITPKPVQLVEKVLQLCTTPDSIILDSFAGSGTTGHAVLRANTRDGGSRRFILVECEEYADSLTAERVRRVINGYPFKGTQRETLYEQKLNFSSLKRADELLADATNVAELNNGAFDKIETKVEAGVLRVTGIRSVDEMAPGLGGSFTYCQLGDPLEIENLLSGTGLPDRGTLAKWLLYVSAGSQVSDSAPAIPPEISQYFVAKQGNVFTWLIYEPNAEFLTSGSAALTLDLARKIAAVDPKSEHRVFSPSKYVSNKVLREEKLNIEHAAIPFALFRRSGA